GDLRRHPGWIKRLNPLDRHLAGQQIAPERLRPNAKRRDDPNTGDDNTSHSQKLAFYPKPQTVPPAGARRKHRPDSAAACSHDVQPPKWVRVFAATAFGVTTETRLALEKRCFWNAEWVRNGFQWLRSNPAPQPFGPLPSDSCCRFQ